MHKIRSNTATINLEEITKPIPLMMFDKLEDKYVYERLDTSNFHIDYDQNTRRRTKSIPIVKTDAYELVFEKGTSAGNNYSLIIGENASLLAYSITGKEMLDYSTRVKTDFKDFDIPDFQNVAKYNSINVKDLQEGDMVKKFAFLNGKPYAHSKKLKSIKKLDEQINSFSIKSMNKNYFIVDQFLVSFE